MFRSPRRVWPKLPEASSWIMVRRLVTALLVGAMVLWAGPIAEAAPRRAKTQVKAKSKVKAKAKGMTRGRTKTKVAAVELPVTNGKVAVFTFKGESAAPINEQVVRVLRTKGMEVMTTLRPVDSAVQYRDMAATLGLAVYVHGQVSDNGGQARATVHVRSGVTGRRIASARFQGDSGSLPADVSRTLWDQVGRAMGRACADAAKPRRQSAPMRIEAGTPIESTPAEEGT